MADFAVEVNHSYSPCFGRGTTVWTPQLTTVMISAMNFGPIEPVFPDSNGKPGRPAGDNRRFFNAVLWIMRSGAPCRDLPSDYGHWNSVFVRFRRLAKAGFWTGLAKLFTDCPDFEWIMINASHTKVHQHGMGAPGGTEDAGRTKGGINTKITQR